MTNTRVRFQISTLFVAGLLAVATAPKASELPDQVSAFKAAVEVAGQGKSRLARGPLARFVAEQFDATLRKHFEAHAIPVLDDDDLLKLFDATDTASFYEGSPKRARQLTKLAIEMQRRNLLDKDKLESVFNALLQARLFASASVLKAAHAELDLEVVPEVSETHDGATPSWYVLEGKTSLKREAAPLQTGAQILVISHPFCHFSENAAVAINRDPALQETFTAHSTWVLPPDRSMTLEAMHDWREEHPGLDIALAYGLDEWSQFKEWDTPTFYFLRDGKIIDTVIGWPKEGRVAELNAALEKIGLSSQAQ